MLDPCTAELIELNAPTYSLTSDTLITRPETEFVDLNVYLSWTYKFTDSTYFNTETVHNLFDESYKPCGDLAVANPSF